MRRPERRQLASPPALFSLQVRVYYQDTDAGGVVYHGTYLDYFERARTEWLRRLGFDVRRLAEQDGTLFIVRELRAAYARPALLDDLVSVTVGVEHLGRAQFTLGQQVLRGHEVLVEASVNLACVTSVGFKPVRVPDRLRETLEAGLGRVGVPSEERT
jgi:acyl-CoA thioester hydrolase